MRAIPRIVIASLFVVSIAACGDNQPDDQLVSGEDSADTGGSGGDGGDEGGDGGGDGGGVPVPDTGGTCTDGNDDGTCDGSGGGGGTCDHDTDGDGTCDGDDDDGGGDCDHDDDGTCDGDDCDHDNDGDCDGDDGGGGHQEGQCTFTLGYWKNHPEAWPVSSLTLGSHSYTQAQLLVILSTEVEGNGLYTLAHQVIAAKLNIAFGAPSSSIASALADADALIGDLVVGTDSLATALTSDLVETLDAFNNSELTDAECD